jgi:hypothetical protein
MCRIENKWERKKRMEGRTECRGNISQNRMWNVNYFPLVNPIYVYNATIYV